MAAYSSDDENFEMRQVRSNPLRAPSAGTALSVGPGGGGGSGSSSPPTEMVDSRGDDALSAAVLERKRIDLSAHGNKFTPVLQMPDELWLSVAYYLDGLELLRLRRACVRLQLFWRNFAFDNFRAQLMPLQQTWSRRALLSASASTHHRRSGNVVASTSTGRHHAAEADGQSRARRLAALAARMLRHGVVVPRLPLFGGNTRDDTEDQAGSGGGMQHAPNATEHNDAFGNDEPSENGAAVMPLSAHSLRSPSEILAGGDPEGSPVRPLPAVSSGPSDPPNRAADADDRSIDMDGAAVANPPLSRRPSGAASLGASLAFLDDVQSTHTGIAAPRHRWPMKRVSAARRKRQLECWMRELSRYWLCRRNITMGLCNATALERHSHAVPALLPNGSVIFSRWQMISCFVRFEKHRRITVRRQKSHRSTAAVTERPAEEATAEAEEICEGDPATSKWARTGHIASHRDTVTVIRYHAPSETVLTGSLDGSVKVWKPRAVQEAPAWSHSSSKRPCNAARRRGFRSRSAHNADVATDSASSSTDDPGEAEDGRQPSFFGPDGVPIVSDPSGSGATNSSSKARRRPKRSACTGDDETLPFTKEEPDPDDLPPGQRGEDADPTWLTCISTFDVPSAALTVPRYGVYSLDLMELEDYYGERSLAPLLVVGMESGHLVLVSCQPDAWQVVGVNFTGDIRALSVKFLNKIPFAASHLRARKAAVEAKEVPTTAQCAPGAHAFANRRASAENGATNNNNNNNTTGGGDRERSFSPTPSSPRAPVRAEAGDAADRSNFAVDGSQAGDPLRSNDSSSDGGGGGGGGEDLTDPIRLAVEGVTEIEGQLKSCVCDAYHPYSIRLLDDNEVTATRCDFDVRPERRADAESTSDMSASEDVTNNADGERNHHPGDTDSLFGSNIGAPARNSNGPGGQPLLSASEIATVFLECGSVHVAVVTMSTVMIIEFQIKRRVELFDMFVSAANYGKLARAERRIVQHCRSDGVSGGFYAPPRVQDDALRTDARCRVVRYMMAPCDVRHINRVFGMSIGDSVMLDSPPICHSTQLPMWGRAAVDPRVAQRRRQLAALQAVTRRLRRLGVPSAGIATPPDEPAVQPPSRVSTPVPPPREPDDPLFDVVGTSSGHVPVLADPAAADGAAAADGLPPAARSPSAGSAAEAGGDAQRPERPSAHGESHRAAEGEDRELAQFAVAGEAADTDGAAAAAAAVATNQRNVADRRDSLPGAGVASGRRPVAMGPPPPRREGRTVQLEDLLADTDSDADATPLPMSDAIGCSDEAATATTATTFRRHAPQIVPWHGNPFFLTPTVSVVNSNEGRMYLLVKGPSTETHNTSAAEVRPNHRTYMLDAINPRSSSFTSAKFSPTSGAIAAGFDDGTIRLYVRQACIPGTGGSIGDVFAAPVYETDALVHHISRRVRLRVSSSLSDEGLSAVRLSPPHNTSVSSVNIDDWKITSIDALSTVHVYDLRSLTLLWVVSQRPRPCAAPNVSMRDHAVALDALSHTYIVRQVAWMNETLLVSPLGVTKHAFVAHFGGKFKKAVPSAAENSRLDAVTVPNEGPEAGSDTRRNTGNTSLMSRRRRFLDRLRITREGDGMRRTTPPGTIQVAAAPSEVFARTNRAVATVDATGTAVLLPASTAVAGDDSQSPGDASVIPTSAAAAVSRSQRDRVFDEESEVWDTADSTLSARHTVVLEAEGTGAGPDGATPSDPRPARLIRVIHAEPKGLVSHALHIVGFPVTLFAIAVFTLLIALRLDAYITLTWWVVLLPHALMWPDYAAVDWLAHNPRMLVHSGTAFNMRLVVDGLYVAVFPLLAVLRYEGYFGPAFTSVSWLWLSMPLVGAVSLNFGAGVFERYRDARLVLQASETTSTSRLMSTIVDAAVMVNQLWLVVLLALYFDSPPSDPDYAFASDFSSPNISIFLATIPLWVAIVVAVIFLPRMQVFSRGQFTVGTLALLIAAYIGVVICFIGPLVLFCLKFNNYYEHAHWSPDSASPAANATAPTMSPAHDLANMTALALLNLTSSPAPAAESSNTRPLASTNAVADAVPLTAIVAPAILLLLAADIQAINNVMNHWQRLMRGVTRRSRSSS